MKKTITRPLSQTLSNLERLHTPASRPFTSTLQQISMGVQEFKIGTAEYSPTDKRQKTSSIKVKAVVQLQLCVNLDTAEVSSVCCCYFTLNCACALCRTTGSKWPVGQLCTKSEPNMLLPVVSDCTKSRNALDKDGDMCLSPFEICSFTNILCIWPGT